MISKLALLALLHAASAPEPLTGTWRIRGDVVGNALNEVCTIAQVGAALTGSCVGEHGKAFELTGEVKDALVTFRHGAEYGGQTLTVTYTGTLAEQVLNGTVKVEPFGVEGTFTATPAAKP